MKNCNSRNANLKFTTQTSRSIPLDGENYVKAEFTILRFYRHSSAVFFHYVAYAFKPEAVVFRIAFGCNGQPGRPKGLSRPYRGLAHLNGNKIFNFLHGKTYAAVFFFKFAHRAESVVYGVAEHAVYFRLVHERQKRTVRHAFKRYAVFAAGKAFSVRIISTVPLPVSMPLS